MATTVDLRTVLTGYCKRGFFLFPLGMESKRPCIKDNLEAASNDIEKLMAWAKEFPGCNWGLSLAKSGLVAVDIDEGGLEEWGILLLAFDEPSTLKARSGSGVGSHYVFKAAPGKRYRGKLAKGIDVKHNGYIAVYPSVHPRTKRRYRWENELSPAALPQWLCERIEKPEFKSRPVNEVYASPETARFRTVIEELKEKSFDYATWVKMGMALHSAFKGSDEGLEIFLDLSSGASFKEGDDELAKRKWDSFSVRGDLSAASFFYAAGELGCTVPQEGQAEDKKLFAANPLPEFKEPPKPAPQWSIDKAGLLTTRDPAFLVKEINSWGYAMLGSNLTGHIIMQWMSENGVPHFRVIAPENFKSAIKDRALKIPTERGWRTVPATEVWGQSSWKMKYRNVVFKPDADFQDLNLWCDIPCSRRKGDVSLVRELIFILCGEDQAKADYLTAWLAHLVQRPHEKPIIVPVFIGEEGAGKGMLFDEIMRRILTNDFYIRLDKAGTIKEKFNVEQSKKFITVLDEASWRGDNELTAVMKSLTGSSTMTVEEKFGARYTIENYSRYVILSNEVEAVRVGLSNRRYIIFTTSQAWKGTDKFGKIMHGLRHEGLHEAFYDFLLGVDISAFDPYVFPAHLDTAGDETKIASMSAVGQFWSDLFFEHPQKIFYKKEEDFFLSKNHAFNAFVSYVDTVRPHGRRFSRRAFTAETESLMPVLKARSTRLRFAQDNQRAWAVDPTAMLQSFCQKSRLSPPSVFSVSEFIDDGDFDKV